MPSSHLFLLLPPTPGWSLPSESKPAQHMLGLSSLSSLPGPSPSPPHGPHCKTPVSPLLLPMGRGPHVPTTLPTLSIPSCFPTQPDGVQSMLRWMASKDRARGACTAGEFVKRERSNEQVGRGIRTNLQCKAPPLTATSKRSSRLKRITSKQRKTKKTRNMDPGPEHHSGLGQQDAEDM